MGTISDFRFDPESGQIQHVLVETVVGAREMPASVLAQQRVPGAGRGGGAEPGTSADFILQPSPERRSRQDPDW
jgi:hypothetical protein